MAYKLKKHTKFKIQQFFISVVHCWADNSLQDFYPVEFKFDKTSKCLDCAKTKQVMW